MPKTVRLPLSFANGLLESEEASLLPSGYADALENFVPRPGGGVRARRGWLNGATAGAPATRRARGIGVFASAGSVASPALRQSVDAFTEGAASQAATWPGATAAGSLLLAGVTARRRPQQVQATTPVPAAGSVTATWPAATTAGNLLVAAVTVMKDTLGGPSLTPPAGWTLAGSVSDSSSTYGRAAAVYYIANAGARSGGEVWATNAGTIAVTMMEFANMATATPFDAHGTNNGSASEAPTVTSAASGQADELVIAVLRSRGALNQDPTNGFAIVAGTGDFHSVLTRSVDVTGAYGTSQSPSQAANTWIAKAVTFKVNTTAPTIATPAGWTERATVAHGTVPLRTSLFEIQGSASRSGAETFTPNVYSMLNVSLLEFTGVATSSATDGAADTDSGTSATASPSPAATTNATDLIVAVVGDGTSGLEQSAPTNGFAEIQGQRQSAYHRAVLATGTYDFDATLSTSATWLTVYQPYKALVTPATDQTYLVAHSDTEDTPDEYELYTITADAISNGTWTETVAEATLEVGAYGVSDTSRIVAFATGLGFIIYSNDDWSGTRSYDGTTEAAIASSPSARGLAFHRNRFFAGGGSDAAAADRPSRLFYSALGAATFNTTDGTGDYIDVAKNDGERIEDVAAAGDGLLIAKQHSIHYLSGTGPDSFSLHRLDEGGGAPGRSICPIPGGAIIAGKEHVWLWSGGTGARRISGPIEDTYGIATYAFTCFTGDAVYILDSASGTIWSYDLERGVWWTERVAVGNDQPAVIFAHGEQMLYGPTASATVSLLAYRDMADGPRSRDAGLAQTNKAHTREEWPGEGMAPFTPKHLYLGIRQRGGDSADAGLVVTPYYDGVAQATQTVAAKDGGDQVFRTRLDVGYKAGIHRVQFFFDQAMTTTDDAVLEPERLFLAGVLDEAR